MLYHIQQPKMELESLEEKQQFLRSEIIQKQIDAESFMDFMGKVKGEGDNIDLDNWSLNELKETVSLYKEQLNKSKQEFMNSRMSREIKKSKIFVLMKKDKFKYEGTNLWDQQQNNEQECSKSQLAFQFQLNSTPKIQIQQWEIKSVGGFLFGIGSRNQLQLTIVSNFTSQKIMRKNEDCDWLKNILSQKNVGAYIPPLQCSRQFTSDDKKGINCRIEEITLFLNTLLNYQIFHYSNDFKEFMTQKNYKQFSDYRSKQSSYSLEKSVIDVYSPSGICNVQISQKINQKIKKSSKIIQDLNTLYGQIDICLHKVITDMDCVGRSLRNLYEATSRMGEKYNEIQSTLSHEQLKLPTILLSMNNSISIISKNLKNHIKALYQFNDNFVKKGLKEWNQLLQLDRRQQSQYKNYLNFKENLLRKKERHISDPTKWELPEADFLRLQRQGIGRISKEEAFAQMFPNDNEKQNQLRTWLSSVNQGYLKSIKLFLTEHQKLLLENYLIYSQKYLSSSIQISNSYEGFRQILGV